MGKNNYKSKKQQIGTGCQLTQKKKCPHQRQNRQLSHMNHLKHMTHLLVCVCTILLLPLYVSYYVSMTSLQLPVNPLKWCELGGIKCYINCFLKTHLS